MYVQLGERFLKIRHNPDKEKATAKAMMNLGKEDEMREELSFVVERFLTTLKDVKVEPVSSEFSSEIQHLAQATAILRTPVSINFWKFEVNCALTPSVEFPTRLSKQLLKLAYELAVVRRSPCITNAEMETVRRIARDTVYPNRLKIVKTMIKTVEHEAEYTTREIADKTDIPLSTCWRELKELEYLGVVKYEKVEEVYNNYTQATRHVPEKDGWTLRLKSLDVLFSVSLNPSGGGMGVNIGKENSSLVLCETTVQNEVASYNTKSSELNTDDRDMIDSYKQLTCYFCDKPIMDLYWKSDNFTENKPAHQKCYDNLRAQLKEDSLVKEGS
jgi:hypothetical protein